MGMQGDAGGAGECTVMQGDAGRCRGMQGDAGGAGGCRGCISDAFFNTNLANHGDGLVD